MITNIGIIFVNKSIDLLIFEVPLCFLISPAPSVQVIFLMLILRDSLQAQRLAKNYPVFMIISLFYCEHYLHELVILTTQVIHFAENVLKILRSLRRNSCYLGAIDWHILPYVSSLWLISVSTNAAQEYLYPVLS